MSAQSNSESYAKMPVVPIRERQWPSRRLAQSPVWCAVDLRDGNQALPNPMTPAQKLEYFQLLCDIGFKEIEVGFPSASHDDFQFTRDLIEKGHIPADVTISVLTQARPHLIEATLKSLAGVKRGVIHLYIATSELHRHFVFGMTREQVIETAVKSTRQIREGVDRMPESNIGFEFSPEEFTDTEIDFAVDICEQVTRAWAPRPGEKVILNLPATVERRLPNEYADLIEEFCRRFSHREQAIVSLHAHNDMGMAVAATMLSLQAGADRVEGTLFGHGERTGNVDLVTLALNMQYLGIATGLDFRKLPEIAETVARVTGIAPHPRTPYSGELVFTAFSGSHQDAIRKGLARREELSARFGGWKVPYLHVSPDSLGRSFERFIRINSQSGKGGIAHIMEQDYHVRLPRWVQIDFARRVQAYCDSVARELSSEELWDLFAKAYVDFASPVRLCNYWPRPTDSDPAMIEGEAHVEYRGQVRTLKAIGNGPISAFVNCLSQLEGMPSFALADYDEETRGQSADAEAACFVRVVRPGNGHNRIGVGFASNIDQAAVRAVVAAVNSYIEG